MSLDRKAIGYITKTVTEPSYQDELVKNMSMEICYKFNTIIPNNICIPINTCLEGYNTYEFYAYIDSGCSICFEKGSLFLEFM